MKNETKRWKKLIVAILLVFGFSMLLPEVFPITNIPTIAEAATPKISSKKLTLIKGQSKTLKVTGTTKTVKWSSDKAAVAKVTQNGKVIAKKRGTAVISAKVGKKTYKCKVTVEEPKLSKKSVSVYVGKNTTLKVSGTKQKVSWNSSNRKIASVSNKGVVKGLKKGTATITAKVGNKKYNCKVTVKIKSVPVNKININKKSISLEVGEKVTLKATVSPSNATNKKIIWSSSNSSVVSVNSKGVVTAKGEGKAYIYAEAGEEIAVCSVEVSDSSDILEPEFSAKLYAKDSYTLLMAMIIKNYGPLPIEVEDYVLLDSHTNLWLIDEDVEFIDSYKIYPDEEEVLMLCKRDYSYFNVYTTSACAFSFWYDDVHYIGVVDYSGKGIYEEYDDDASSIEASISIRRATLEDNIRPSKSISKVKVDKFYDTLEEKIKVKK